jgi:hypothetical protein
MPERLRHQRHRRALVGRVAGVGMAEPMRGGRGVDLGAVRCRLHDVVDAPLRYGEHARLRSRVAKHRSKLAAGRGDDFEVGPGGRLCVSCGGDPEGLDQLPSKSRKRRPKKKSWPKSNKGPRSFRPDGHHAGP